MFHYVLEFTAGEFQCGALHVVPADGCMDFFDAFSPNSLCARMSSS